MRFGHREAVDLADILRAAAKAEVMPRFRRLGDGAVRMKTGPLDLVTDADEAAERHIAAALRARFPDCLVVGEEAAAADPGLLGRLPGAELAFVVDPVDGTFNYAAGVPLFGVMAAAIVRGEPVLAAIHDPLGDDTALALRGEGAWIERPDGARSDLHVAPPVELSEMTGMASWQFLPPPLRARVCANLPRLSASWNYRCAAHEYRVTAGGFCHFLLYYRVLPWDHAPGWLLHREAGGYSARFEGSAYSPLETAGGLLSAPDRGSWEALREILLGL